MKVKKVESTELRYCLVQFLATNQQKKIKTPSTYVASSIFKVSISREYFKRG